jgi:AcrR family transcriptional regulator
MPSRPAPTPRRAPSEAPRAGRGRPRTIDTDKVLEVAREVFLEHGMRATTLEVAQRAGISEGAVFHRFKTKEAMFRAAMRFDEEEFPRRLTSALENMQHEDVQEALLFLGEQIMEIGKVALPLMMMAWSNPTRGNEVPVLHKNKTHYLRVIQQFAVWCNAQVEAGKLRFVDPEIFARAFIGSIHNYSMSRLLVGEQAIPEAMFVRGLIDLLLRGALPDSGETRSLTARRERR